MQSVLSLLTALLVATSASASSGSFLTSPTHAQLQAQFSPAQQPQTRTAEQACTSALWHQGYSVNEIVEATSFAGGRELIMVVQNQRETIVVGCDYATATGEVSLYRLDDTRYNRRNDRPFEQDWQNQYYHRFGVRHERHAADIARSVVSQQLQLSDPYASILRIDRVSQPSSQQTWVVEGRVNGAPFVVQIRASDAYILGFDLY